MKNQRFLRGPFVWIAVLLVALFMTVNLISSASAPKELTFNEFVELARDGAFEVDESARKVRRMTLLLAVRGSAGTATNTSGSMYEGSSRASPARRRPSTADSAAGAT